MSQFIFLLLMGIHSTAAVTHSMKYFYTASSKVQNFPEFVAVGLVDDVQMVYFDSITKKPEPTQDWIKENTDQDYWDGETNLYLGHMENFKHNIEVAKQRFNQTGGVHIFQQMYGCEWDDETEEVTGYFQYGYDGEDFLTLSIKEDTWIAAKQQAVITKNKWNNDRHMLASDNNYFNHICPEWLEKYVNYGRRSLMRTDLPSVSFLKKSCCSPVSCHATGFYPNRAEMFWRKDGEEVHDGVVKGEILPNNDGTFQMSVDIDLSSVAPEDWNKYECVFQLSGVKEDIVHRLEKTGTRSNEPNMIIIPVVGGVISGLLCFIGVIGVLNYKSKNGCKEVVLNMTIIHGFASAVLVLSGVIGCIVYKKNGLKLPFLALLMIILGVVGLAVVGVVRFILNKKMNAKRPPSPVDNSEPSEETKFLSEA